MTKAQLIRNYKKENPDAKAKQIAEAMGTKLQYVYTVLHKAKTKRLRGWNRQPKPVVTKEETQLVKGQMLLRDEINSLHRQITRLKLHNEMLQSMLKVQEFDLMHGHGATV